MPQHPTEPESTSLSPVHGVVANGATTTLTVGLGEQGRSITIDAIADLVRAMRWRKMFRRIDRVEIRLQGSRPICRLHGTGHRLPIERAVPVSVALGLGRLGVPLSLRT